jgi:iron complex outermembrane receptor protein
MKSLFKALLLLSISSISAQNTITGIVIDKSTNESIIFANIYLPDLEKGTTTDDNGIFKIENLPSGTYKIIVSFIGYETQS